MPERFTRTSVQDILSHRSELLDMLASIAAGATQTSQMFQPSGQSYAAAGLGPTVSAPSSTGFSGSFGELPTQGKLIGRPFQGTHTLGNWESDQAVDIAIPVGTPIVAPDDGVIGERFGSLGQGGRFAGLRFHLMTKSNEFYGAHLSGFAPGIEPGARVKRGQIIGFSGSANGVPHLHWAARNDVDSSPAPTRTPAKRKKTQRRDPDPKFKRSL